MLLARIKRRMSMDVLDNRIQYLLLVFFLVVGITAGTFTVSHMEPGEKTALTGYMESLFAAVKTQNINYFSIFIHAFLQDTLIFGAVAMFSLVMFGMLMIPVLLIVKGFFVGFGVGVLSINLGMGGFAAIVFCEFIPNIVLIPCICKAGVTGVNNCILVFKNRKIPYTARDRLISSKPHISRMFIIYLVSLIGVILETLLTPLLIKLI
jgi:stage II sporulation protein M